MNKDNRPETTERVPASGATGVMPPPNIGREEQAIRWAINNFEEWHNITDVPPKHSTYYYEILACIEDAAKIGFGVAHDQDLETIKKHLAV